LAGTKAKVEAVWTPERAIWHLLSALAVISYTGNSIYVIFAATGSWISAYFSVR
jgi:hypothetical protein